MGIASELFKALFRKPGSQPPTVYNKPPDLLMFEAAQRRLKRETENAHKQADAFGSMLDEMISTAKATRRNNHKRTARK